MREPAIRVDSLWKEYAVGQRRHHDTLYAALSAGMGKILGRPSAGVQSNERTDSVFWALRDLSFDAAPGDVVGVIGRNGAGKSTLLKVVSRIAAPTRGRIEIRGRLASLLEVGTGFHPELTGRENIFLNGAILGMSRREVAHNFDAIVEFAEIGRFLDTPVKRYSSGMYVRLAFAVAAHLQTDILLVDEVLAVGDVQFQEKCLGKMRNVSGDGRTILFVSHNMGMIAELCNRCILLDGGVCRQMGDPRTVIQEYFSSRSSPQHREFRGPLAEDVHVHQILVNSAEAGGSVVVQPSEPLRMSIRGEARRTYPDVQFALTLSASGTRLATLHDCDGFRPLPQGDFVVEFTVPAGLLRPGDYLIGFGADRERVHSWFYGDNLVRLTVAEQWSPAYPPNRHGLINLTPEEVQGSRRGAPSEELAAVAADNRSVRE